MRNLPERVLDLLDARSYPVRLRQSQHGQAAIGLDLEKSLGERPGARGRHVAIDNKQTDESIRLDTKVGRGDRAPAIDQGSGETLNESGVRHLRVEVQKNSPFSKLLERLSERMKKS